ncbi:hypothetical protein BGP_3677 [Beggiatoa sp. PS]|nr:hypothetical protein BGP_3677 [Beggiatoa sp. PS]
MPSPNPLSRGEEVFHRLHFLFTENIACTTNRVQQGFTKIFINFTAQATNMYINHIRLRIKMIIPNIF